MIGIGISKHRSPTMKPGETCEACPVGAICTGSTDSPMPRPGYFARSTSAPSSTNKKAEFHGLTSLSHVPLNHCCVVALQVLEGFPFELRDGKFCTRTECHEKEWIAKKAFIPCV